DRVKFKSPVQSRLILAGFPPRGKSRMISSLVSSVLMPTTRSPAWRLGGGGWRHARLPQALHDEIGDEDHHQRDAAELEVLLQARCECHGDQDGAHGDD